MSLTHVFLILCWQTFPCASYNSITLSCLSFLNISLSALISLAFQWGIHPCKGLLWEVNKGGNAHDSVQSPDMKAFLLPMSTAPEDGSVQPCDVFSTDLREMWPTVVMWLMSEDPKEAPRKEHVTTGLSGSLCFPAMAIACQWACWCLRLLKPYCRVGLPFQICCCGERAPTELQCTCLQLLWHRSFWNAYPQDLETMSPPSTSRVVTFTFHRFTYQ